MIHNKKTLKGQSAMEYLMTYGWAILIIAVVLAALFELGVFGSGGTPQACIAQSGYICATPTFSSAGSSGSFINFSFGQNTGQTFYSVNVFVAQEGESLTSGSANVIGVPVNMSLGSTPVAANTVAIGTLQSGQIYPVSFGGNLARTQAGGMPIGPVIGTPFYGYVWVTYCTLGPCPGGVPTNWAKVATLALKSTH
jgi:hypothetical protein